MGYGEITSRVGVRTAAQRCMATPGRNTLRPGVFAAMACSLQLALAALCIAAEPVANPPQQHAAPQGANDPAAGSAVDASPMAGSPAQADARSGRSEETPVVVKADSIDLGEPVAVTPVPLSADQAEAAAVSPAKPAPEAKEHRRALEPAARPAAAGATAKAAAQAPPHSASATERRKRSRSLVMLGTEVPPATSTRLHWAPNNSFEGIAAGSPVLVVHGAKPGPALCLTAAVHGDELNGIEIVRRVLYNLDAHKLSGTVIGVPIVNLQGFRRGSRYLPDRRDLNRYFPGDPSGSSAARIAHSFFKEVISHCNALVDLHTGSFYRANLPQLRANLRDSRVLEFSQGFDGTVVLHSDGAVGTLRQAALAAGIPAVALEAGEPMRLQEQEVDHGVQSIQSLLGKMGMVKKASRWGNPEPVYYQSIWVRADQGGILFSDVALGKRVRRDEVLGTVTDPITNVRTEILSPYSGRVLGMALNQVVMPGFAAYRIGIESSGEDVVPGYPPLSAPAALHTSQVQPAETSRSTDHPQPGRNLLEDSE